MFWEWFTVLLSKDASKANTVASGDNGKSKNHVIMGSATKGLNMKVAIPVVGKLKKSLYAFLNGKGKDCFA